MDSTLAIGSSHRVWSQALQESRRIFVRVPPHYAQAVRPFPVLYVLDAETQFRPDIGIVESLASFSGRIPEMIVVGITNTDRTRDLTPPVTDPRFQKTGRGGGGAATFLAFLADELVPWVDARYRTAPFRILVGHSFGGLFSTFALTRRPEVFQAHIAASPSLWWDNERFLTRTIEGVRALPRPPWLFVSWGDNEANIRDSTRKLVAALSSDAAPHLLWAHRYYPGEDHMSTPHRSLYDALGLLFSDWRIPIMVDDVEQELTLAAVDAHCAELSRRFGFSVVPTATVLANVADSLRKHNDDAGALAVLRRSVREYPYLPETHGQLAETLKRLGRREEALLIYEQALRAAVDDESPYGDPVSSYLDNVRQLRGTRRIAGDEND